MLSAFVYFRWFYHPLVVLYSLGLHLFRKFAARHFQEENVLFWCEVSLNDRVIPPPTPLSGKNVTPFDMETSCAWRDLDERACILRLQSFQISWLLFSLHLFYLNNQVNFYNNGEYARPPIGTALQYNGMLEVVELQEMRAQKIVQWDKSYDRIFTIRLSIQK